MRLTCAALRGGSGTCTLLSECFGRKRGPASGEALSQRCGRGELRRSWEKFSFVKSGALAQALLPARRWKRSGESLASVLAPLVFMLCCAAGLGSGVVMYW